MSPVHRVLSRDYQYLKTINTVLEIWKIMRLTEESRLESHLNTDPSQPFVKVKSDLYQMYSLQFETPQDHVNQPIISTV